MITKDKYGFIEEIPEARPRTGKGMGPDFIGAHLKQPGYLAPFRVDRLIFSRYYFGAGLLVDIFKANNPEAETEIRYKKKYCSRRKLIYIPIGKGESLTLAELKKYLNQKTK